MLIDKSPKLAAKKDKPLSMAWRLVVSAIGGLFTYGVLWSVYYRDYALLGILTGLGVIMLAYGRFSSDRT